MLDGPDGGDGQAARIDVELPINTYSGSLYDCSDIIPAANEWTMLGFSIRHIGYRHNPTEYWHCGSSVRHKLETCS